VQGGCVAIGPASAQRAGRCRLFWPPVPEHAVNLVAAMALSQGQRPANPHLVQRMARADSADVAGGVKKFEKKNVVCPALLVTASEPLFASFSPIVRFGPSRTTPSRSARAAVASLPPNPSRESAAPAVHPSGEKGPRSRHGTQANLARRRAGFSTETTLRQKDYRAFSRTPEKLETAFSRRRASAGRVQRHPPGIRRLCTFFIENGLDNLGFGTGQSPPQGRAVIVHRRVRAGEKERGRCGRFGNRGPSGPLVETAAGGGKFRERLRRPGRRRISSSVLVMRAAASSGSGRIVGKTRMKMVRSGARGRVEEGLPARRRPVGFWHRSKRHENASSR